jgi:hypothetical protein
MADPVSGTDRVATLASCLGFLGHPPPAAINDLDQLWLWAQENWQMSRVSPGSKVTFFTAKG